jgi:hypothetical protein
MKKKLSYLLFLILTNSVCAIAGIQTEAEEYTLKAAFIYNFTNFVEWSSSSEEQFVIGVLGNSLIAEPLEEIARTKMVRNKKIVIREFSSPDEITPCDILFVSKNSPFALEEIISSSIVKKTLVICEKRGAAVAGACINFVVVNDKLKFETNLNSINAAGLKVSSQLLKLAIVVN